MQETFFFIVGVVAIYKLIVWVEKISKHQTIIISDKCSECPFMRSHPSPSEVDYGCSLMKRNERFDNMAEMNSVCPVGGKIEISISKQ